MRHNIIAQFRDEIIIITNKSFTDATKIAGNYANKGYSVKLTNKGTKIIVNA